MCLPCACQTASCGFYFLPVLTVGAVFLTTKSLNCDKVISRLAFMHIGTPKSLFHTVLRQRGTHSHFLTASFITLSNFSTSEIATLYAVKGHLMRGKIPNCKQHNFKLPGQKVLINSTDTLHNKFYSETCTQSLNEELYNLSKLFTSVSTIDGITSPSI